MRRVWEKIKTMAKKKGNVKKEEVKPEGYTVKNEVEYDLKIENSEVPESEFVSEEKVVDEVVSRPINGGCEGEESEVGE